jgi:hypothetical protein
MTEPKVFSWSLVAAIALAGACSEGEVKIGEQADAQVRSGIDSFSANWDGYIEAYTFSDGSDRVRISIKEDGKGTIRFGNEEIWPQPTNASDTYPPYFPPAAGLPNGTDMPMIWSGYLFDLKNVQVETDRLRANALSTQLFENLCKLQTTYLLEPGIYACLPCDFAVDYKTVSVDGGEASIMCRSLTSPCWGATDATGTEWASVPITCEQEALCANGDYNAGVRTGLLSTAICTCDANGCGLVAHPPDIVLDTTLIDGQQTLTGSLVFGSSNRTIWLKRQ